MGTEHPGGVRGIPNTWLAGIAVLVVMLVVAGALFYADQMRHLQNTAEASLSAIGRLKTDQIAKWREDRLADGRRVTDAPGLAALVDSWLDEATPDRVDAVRRTLESLRYGDRYTEVLLIDSRGRVLLSTGSEQNALHGEVYEALPKAIESRNAVLTEIHKSDASDEVHFGVIAPLTMVRPREGASYAILLHAHADETLFPLVATWPVPSDTAETLLLRRDGDELVFLNNARHVKKTALRLRRPLDEVSTPSARATLGKTGVVKGTDYRGEEVLAYLDTIPGSEWHIVAKIDTKEAFADLGPRSRLIVLLLVSVLGVVIGSGVTAWQQNTNRQLSRLLHVERSRLTAEERYRVTLDSVGDAVIATDANCRVEFMNPVAEQLTGWRAGEAVGAPLDTVFDIINEYTREPVENPARRVMREGMIVGLANHTLLRSRSGEERAIADSGAPIRDESGVVSGAVLVFRDQTAEREAERALIESEERFRALVEQAPVAVFVQAEGRFAYVNPAALELLGSESPDELLGTPIVACFPYAAAWIEAVERLPVGSTAYVEPSEEMLKRLDSRTCVVELSARPVRYMESDVAVIFARDITASRREEQVRLARLEAFERVGDLPFEPLLRGFLDRVCDMLESSIGFFHFVESDEQSVVLGVWSTFTDSDFCKAQGSGSHYSVDKAGVWADAVRMRTPTIHNDYGSLEGRKGMPDGHVPLIRELVVPVIRDGSVVAVLGVGNRAHEYCEDDAVLAGVLGEMAYEVAQYKRAHDAVLSSERILRIAGELTHVGGWSIDLTRSILEWSEETARIHGVPPDYVPTVETAIDFYAPGSREVITACFTRCCEDGTPYDVELEIVRQDGERVWVRTAGEPVRDENGAIVSVHGGFQDITQRKRFEDELRQYRGRLEDLVAERTCELEEANRRLEEATKAKSRFLANMSHELRTPLNAIIGFSSLLDQELAGDLNEEQSYQVKTILSAGRHLLSLIADVLDLSKVEAGSVEVHIDEFDPTDLLSDVVATLEPLALDKGLRLTCDSRIPGELLRSDAGKVRQILMNLIGNAIKFTDRGWVEIRLGEDDRSNAVFAVRDSGKGIEADDLPLVFQAFKQVEYSGMAKPEGTGLGLAISQEYARLLGGSIEAQSEPGVGSTFRLRLPLNGR